MLLKWLTRLLLLVSGLTIALAQDERLLLLPDGGTLRYSGDWVITTPSGTFERNELRMRSDARELYVWIYFTPLSTLREHNAVRLLDFVVFDYSLYQAAETQPFNPNRVVLHRVAGVQIAEYTFQHPDPEFPYDITVLYRLTPDGDGLSIEATSYYDIEVGDISSLYEMLASYEPPTGRQLFIQCIVDVPYGIVLRERPSVLAAPVRTVTRRSGEMFTAVAIRVDGSGSDWYQVEAPQEAYVRRIVATPLNSDCALLPRVR